MACSHTRRRIWGPLPRKYPALYYGFSFYHPHPEEGQGDVFCLSVHIWRRGYPICILPFCEGYPTDQFQVPFLGIPQSLMGKGGVLQFEAYPQSQVGQSQVVGAPVLGYHAPWPGQDWGTPPPSLGLRYPPMIEQHNKYLLCSEGYAS